MHVAQAELARATQAQELAESSFKRKQELFEQNLISKDLYDQAKNDLATSSTAVITAEARLEQANAQLQVSQVIVQQAKNQVSTLIRQGQFDAAADLAKKAIAQEVKIEWSGEARSSSDR